jgi:signal transduction histidine kinase
MPHFDPTDPSSSDASRATSVPGRDKKAQSLLIGGFALMIALLGADGFIGFRGMVSIRARVSALTRDHFRNVALIDDLQRAQASFGSVLYGLSTGVTASGRERLKTGIDAIEQSLKDLFAGVPADDPDIALWRAVERAAAEATSGADRVLDSDLPAKADLTVMVAARERLAEATASLIRANHERAEITTREIDQLTSRQLTRDAVLLTACLLIAVLCAWLVLRTASRLHRQVTGQATELSRVSWQLLERQENLARRLSHELHDELGQSLTALKTNFARFSSAGPVDAKWAEDCSQLLKDSIRGAHEISQLLRPTILDDFGLDSALAWLCERFEARNRIPVAYRSDFHERLAAQAETHVFRIAQEALTNVAKHANATRVEVSLERNGSSVRFRVADNGAGFRPRQRTLHPHFGLTGMRARARGLEGEMTAREAPGGGVEIVIAFPWKRTEHETEDTNLVSG